MKHLIIGDVHGDLLIIDLAVEHYPDHHLLFLGDLVDSFDKPVSTQIECVYKVLDLINKGKADCILGNHELSYFHYHLRASGWTVAMNAHLQPIRREIEKNFLPYVYFSQHNVLVSHAGLTKPLWEAFSGVKAPLDCEVLKAWSKDIHSPFYSIGYARHGLSKFGGLVWCDWQEEFRPIPGLTQVVGHTASKGGHRRFKETKDGELRIINGNNWNIDCLQRSLDVLEYNDETGIFQRKDLA